MQVEVLRGFAQTLYKYLNGHIELDEVFSSIMLCHCQPENALTLDGYISRDAYTICGGDAMDLRPDQHLVKISSLPEQYQGKCLQWNKVMWDKYKDGTLFFPAPHYFEEKVKKFKDEDVGVL